MTLYDAAMIGLILVGMAWGAWRGVVWQLAGLLSVVLGYTAAHTLSDDAVAALRIPGEPATARGLAMVVIYVAVSAGVFLAAWLIRAVLRRVKFEAYDRHLGMLLGGVQAGLLGLVATLFVVSLAPESRRPIFESPTGKVVGLLMSKLGPVLPSEAQAVLAPFWNDPPARTRSARIAGDDPSGAADDPNAAPQRLSETDARTRSLKRR
jgi:membrane protein required for colicin V production